MPIQNSKFKMKRSRVGIAHQKPDMVGNAHPTPIHPYTHTPIHPYTPTFWILSCYLETVLALRLGCESN